MGSGPAARGSSSPAATSPCLPRRRSSSRPAANSQLRSGGLATSGKVRRRWLRGGEWQHHLIDPRTGRPAASPWDEVTVAARSCLEADVAAKAAFLLGDAGPTWLDARGLPGRFLADGAATVNDAWRTALFRDS